MDMTEEIVTQVPYLRRFARAMCCSQDAGDACVKRLLEGWFADKSELAGAPSLKIAMFRSLVRVLAELAPDDGRFDDDRKLTALDRSVAQMGYPSRQAFVLTSVEGFSTSEAAQILDTSEAGVRALLESARSEIARHAVVDVLIIEDEMFIALELEALVSGLGHSVRAIASTKSEAVAAASRFKPGLILADIQLADGSSGLEAANDIVAARATPVIFITAYPERWLTGKRPEPAFLINKPFQADAVRATISQALFFGVNRRAPDRTGSTLMRFATA